MKASKKDEISTFRMLIASLNNQKIAKKGELTDKDAIAVLRTEVKKRDEAAQAYKEAGRVSSAEKEGTEKEIIKRFLPEEISDEALVKIVDEVISGAGEDKQFGPLMQQVMTKVGGAADGSRVSKLLKEKIT